MTAGSDRLRVLEVVASYFPELGGSESHVHEVSKRLAQCPDLEVTVLDTDCSGILPLQEWMLDGFDLLRCRSYPRKRDYYISPGLARVIKSGSWDLVHFQGVHTFVPILGMLAARQARLPYVLTFHTGGHSSPQRSWLRGTQWKLLTPLLRKASRLIAVSRFSRRRFEEATGIDPAHFVVIQNGGALPPVVDPVTPVPGRIVSSGRLERYKGHHRVIEALPILRSSLPDAHLVILGSGPYEHELRAQAKRLGVADHVSIRQIDPRDRGSMARELASAQTLAASSDYEAHPVAVMEALALGVPVVGFNVAGIGDLVEEGLVTGLSPVASPEATAEALRTTMEGGRRSLADTVSPPTWETCADQLADVYRAVFAETK